MAELQEVVKTYTYVLSGLSGETQMSYCDKLAVFAEFCAGRDIHTLEAKTSPRKYLRSLYSVVCLIKEGITRLVFLCQKILVTAIMGHMTLLASGALTYYLGRPVPHKKMGRRK